MQKNKIPAGEIRAKREKLGLSISQICKRLEIEKPTWERWERVDSAPAFVNYLFKYLEQNPNDSFKNTSAIQRTIGTESERFMAKVMTDSDSDCRIWCGGSKFKTSDGRSVTFRKAAWKIYHGIIPIKEIKTICENPKCVYVNHLFLGRVTGAGKHQISPSKRGAIIFDLRKNKLTGSQIADKYQVSAGFVSNLKKEINNITK